MAQLGQAKEVEKKGDEEGVKSVEELVAKQAAASALTAGATLLATASAGEFFFVLLKMRLC